MKRIRKILLFFAAVSVGLPVFATHNRAGYILYQHVSGLKYKIIVHTFTDPNSPADRPSLPVDFGDGQTDSVQRNTIIPIYSYVQENIYETEHTYQGPGSYIVSVTDPNRTAGSMNIPMSVNVPFYIETSLTISPFVGYDNSPVIQFKPIDNGCVNRIYNYTPGATDADGDSLAYSLHKPMADHTHVAGAAGYTYPAASNSFTIDAHTGLVTWNTPILLGNYNFDIMISEYRNGVKIGYMLEDIQVSINACNNYPPTLTVPPNFCVVAGDTVHFFVSASDPDGDNTNISAQGIPLNLNISPALFNPPQVLSSSVTGEFFWATKCDHVQKNDYQVNFKAIDVGAQYPFAVYGSTDILVIGPPVTLSVAPQGSGIQLVWTESSCPQVVKYDIYRREGPSGWTHSQCETGIPASTGFVKIGETNSLTDTTFYDNNNGAGLIPGNDYCYRIVAIYPDGAESYASNEACAMLQITMPVIIKVSVDSTSTTNGKMDLAWIRPLILDSNQYQGPYRYLIYRNSGQGYQLIDSTNSIMDTTYIDTGLNTQNIQYGYRIDLYNLTGGAHDLIGQSAVAKSVFLSHTSTDSKLILSWNVSVSWINNSYVVYKENTLGGFDSIATVSGTTYTDSNLINGQTYCYKIKSIGQYSAVGLPAPLINFSQINCGIPIDNVPPCKPVLNIDASCEDFSTILTWSGNNEPCDADVASYKIYFTPDSSADMTFLKQINNPFDTSYTHIDSTSIAGCYSIVSIDSAGNISPFSDSVCVDNCPLYHLPNIFTPNNDGKNDFFKPFPYRYVDHVDLHIFNRWGTVVFKTHNPDINWNGKDVSTGKICSEGTYYYVCVVYLRKLKGLQTKVLKGYIELLK